MAQSNPSSRVAIAEPMRPEPEDADLHPVDVAAVRERASAGPPTGTHIPVGGTEAAQGHQHQPDGGVGDGVGQHVGGVAQADSVGARGSHVDRVVTDAVAHDRAQVGQRGNQIGIDTWVAPRHDHPDGFTVFGQESCTIAVGRQPQRLVSEGQLGRQHRLQRPDLQYLVRLGCRHDSIIRWPSWE